MGVWAGFEGLSIFPQCHLEIILVKAPIFVLLDRFVSLDRVQFVEIGAYWLECYVLNVGMPLVEGQGHAGSVGLVTKPW